jgi:hypothetical protein
MKILCDPKYIFIKWNEFDSISLQRPIDFSKDGMIGLYAKKKESPLNNNIIPVKNELNNNKSNENNKPNNN